MKKPFWDTPGTVVLFCGLLTIAAIKIPLATALRTYGETLDQFKLAIVTVMAVVGLAYVMNLTGMTTTLGRWVAGSGGLFAFLSPIIGRPRRPDCPTSCWPPPTAPAACSAR